MLQNLRISTRLGLAFGAVLVLLLAVGGAAVWSLNHLSNLNQAIYQHPFAVSNAVLRVQNNVLKIQRAMRDMVMAMEESDMQAQLVYIRLWEYQVRESFALVQKRYLGDPKDVQRAQELFWDWHEINQREMALVSRGNWDLAGAIARGKGSGELDEIMLALDGLRDFAHNKAAAFLDQSERSSNQAYLILYLMIALALLLGGVFTIVITRSISRPVQAIAGSLESIAQGNLRAVIPEVRQSELSQMAQSLRKLLTGVLGEGQSIKAALPAHLWTTDPDMVLSFINPACAPLAETLSDRPLHQIVGVLRVGEVFGDQPGEIGDLARQVLRDHEAKRADIRFDTGRRGQFFEVSISPIRDLEGRVTGLVGVGMDVTERELAERARAQSEERFRTLVGNVPGVVYRCLSDEDWTMTFISDEIEKLSGYPASDFIDNKVRTYNSIINPRDRRRVLEEIQAGLEEDGRFSIEYRIARADGSKAWVFENGSGVASPRGGFLWLDGVILDITKDKKARRAKEASERLYRGLFQNAQDGILLMRADGSGGAVVVNGNRAAASMHGYEQDELMGLPISSLYPEGDEPVWGGCLDSVMGGEWTRYEADHRCKDGTSFPASVSAGLIDQGKLHSILFFVRDISKRRQAEKERSLLEVQLRQSQKLQAIGTLAGGIAHDFNNILAAMLGYTELTLSELKPDSDQAEYLSQVMAAGDRARNLVKQILAFSRQGEIKMSPTALASVVKEAMKLLRATIPSTIDIRAKGAFCELAVLADPIQMHQVIINLCTNAAQAMEEKGGVLEIGLDLLELGELEAQKYLELEPGRYMRLSVADTGPGMSPEVKSRIFEPFYTTKEAGRGTGMGLATVHGIVLSHGGEIAVYSELGQGTVFHVYLPVYGGEKGEIPFGVHEEIPGGSERVMLVDDEPALLEVGALMLGRLGYSVASFASPEEALSVMEKDPQAFDLLITDYTMPGMTGDKLGERARELKPGLPYLLCTGFTRRLDDDSIQLISASQILIKPLSYGELAKAVRRALDG